MKLLVTFATLLALSCSLHAQVEFARFFFDETMRVDYYHTGTKDSDAISLDKVFREGVWAGSRTALVDTLNLGEYLFRVFDLKTGMLLYSRGFSSYFNEWQTTNEAALGARKTVHESALFPFPKYPVQFSVLRRDKRSVFQEVFSCTIDPKDPTVVSTEQRRPSMEVVDLLANGDPHRKVDIVIIGDGYAAKDQQKFKDDARHFADVLMNTSPFKEHKKDFNIRAVCAISAESGIDKPDANVWKNTALHTMYNTFGSERYVLTEGNRELRDLCAAVPYDFITILINDNRYGGGGIYQLYTTTFTISDDANLAWQRDYVYVHEFGHSFGGLGDEYYSSSTGYNDFYPAGVEPWEPNITRNANDETLKWKTLLSPGVTVPTEWNKAAYDSVSASFATLDRKDPEVRKKIQEGRKKQQDIMNQPSLRGLVGAFEGAGYVPKGIYRPAVDCRMFSLSLVDFDPVCRAAIERQIEMYVK